MWKNERDINIGRWDEAFSDAPVRRWKGKWSGRWDSNPRPQPWQGCALPLSYARRSLMLLPKHKKNAIDLRDFL